MSEDKYPADDDHSAPDTPATMPDVPDAPDDAVEAAVDENSASDSEPAIDAEVVDRAHVGEPEPASPPADARPALPFSVRFAAGLGSSFLVLFGAMLIITMSMTAYEYRDDGALVAAGPGGELLLTFTHEDCVAPCLQYAAGATVQFMIDAQIVASNTTNDLGEATLVLPKAGGQLVVTYNNQTWVGDVLITKDLEWPVNLDVSDDTELPLLGIDPARAKQGLFLTPVGVMMLVGGAAGFARRGYALAMGGASLTLALGVVSLVIPMAPPLWILIGGLAVWGYMRSRDQFRPLRS